MSLKSLVDEPSASSRRTATPLATYPYFFLVSWIVLGIFASIIFEAFGPWTSNGTFTSDHALSLLMANATKWRWEDLFIWGQDRLGTWPYLIMRISGLIFGNGCSLAFFFTLLVSSVCLSFICLQVLARKDWWFLWPFLAAHLGITAAGREILKTASLLPWQLPGVLVFWAWYRCVGRSIAKQTAGTFFLQVSMGYVLAFLPTWMSPASLPLLAWIVVSECIERRRLRLKVNRALVVGCLPIIGGAGTYWLITQLHARYAAPVSSSDMTFSVTEFGRRIALLNGRCLEWAWLRPGLIVAAFCPLLQLWFLIRGNAARNSELLHVGLTAGTLAFGNALMVLLSDHMFGNEFDLRYLYPSAFFLAVGAPALFLTVLRAAISQLLSETLAVAVAGSLAVFMMLHWPSSVERVDGDFAAIARQLKHKASGLPLMGDYWGVYSIGAYTTAAHPDSGISPIAVNHEHDVAPWNKDLADTAPLIVGAHAHYLPMSPRQAPRMPREWSSTFGSPDHPIPYVLFGANTLLQYERPLLRDINGFYGFSFYRNRSDAVVWGSPCATTIDVASNIHAVAFWPPSERDGSVESAADAKLAVEPVGLSGSRDEVVVSTNTYPRMTLWTVDLVQGEPRTLRLGIGDDGSRPCTAATAFAVVSVPAGPMQFAKFPSAEIGASHNNASAVDF